MSDFVKGEAFFFFSSPCSALSDRLLRLGFVLLALSFQELMMRIFLSVFGESRVLRLGEQRVY